MIEKNNKYRIKETKFKLRIKLQVCTLCNRKYVPTKTSKDICLLCFYGKK